MRTTVTNRAGLGPFIQEDHVISIIGVFDELIGKKYRWVVLHSSLKAFRIPNPIEHILEALFRFSDQRDVTFFLPTFSPQCCQTGMFSVKNTTCSTGVLPEYFRKIEGVVRGRHPIDSYAAYGPDKKEVLAFWGDPLHGKGSACQSFKANNALLVAFGCDVADITFLHHEEFMANVPYRFLKQFKGSYDDGSPYSFKSLVRKVHLEAEDTFIPVQYHLDKDELIHKSSIVGAQVQTIDAATVSAYMIDLLKKDPFICLKDKDRYQHLSRCLQVSFLSSDNTDLLAQEFETQASQLLQLIAPALNCHRLPFGTYRQDLFSEQPLVVEYGLDYGIFCERFESLFPFLMMAGEYDDSLIHDIDCILDDYTTCIRQFVKLSQAQAMIFDFAFPLQSSWRKVAQLQKIITDINERLAHKLDGIDRVKLFPYGHVAHLFGINTIHHQKSFLMGRIPFSNQFNADLSRALCGKILFEKGKTMRAVVLDLDNTLWGGIVGESGPSEIELGHDFPGNAYCAFQRYLLGLKQSGIFLALCSKNDPDKALFAIRSLPDMVLTESDFSSIKINWRSKADNILEIARELNISLENICFIDDSVHERAEVQAVLPQVYIPSFPRDIADLPLLLLDDPYFYSDRLTREDYSRNDGFKINIQHKQIQEKGGDLNSFYTNLNMEVVLIPLNQSPKSRLTQLINKTNQFNTTTRRYSYEDLEAIERRGGMTFSLHYRDRIISQGEHIGIIVVEKDEQGSAIALFLMSCRYMQRTIETKVLALLSALLKERGEKVLRALYIPSKKNKPVEHLYESNGFSKISDQVFSFDLDRDSIVPPSWFKDDKQ
jgi:FkbH-like protein